jgi:hypothetical protein
VGRRFDDLGVLRLSALFEAARPWAQHRPRHLDSPVSATGAQAGSVSTPSERTFAQKDAATMTHWAFVTGGGTISAEPSHATDWASPALT